MLFTVALLLVIASPAQQTSAPELTLDRAIEQGLQHNSSFKTAQFDTAKAAKDLAANATKRFADIQLTALGGQLLTKPSISFAPGSLGDFPATGPIPATDQRISIPRKPVGVLFASISQPLTKEYRLHLSLKALSLGVAATREDQQKQKLATIDQVRRTYFDVAKAQSELDSVRLSLPYYQESKRLADQNFKTEAVLRSQLLQAEVQLEKNQDALSEAGDQISAAMEKLNDLMGRDIHTEFRVSDIQTADGDFQTRAALETLALQNRPDLKKARLQVLQAEYDSRAKKAEYIPDVSLSFDYLKTTNFGNTLPTDITTAGLLLTWEPWDWGRKRQELAGKRIQEEQAKIAVQATERSVLLEVSNAWRQLQNTRRQLRLSDTMQRAAREKLRESQEQARREQILTRDLFSAQSDLANADSQHRQALSAFWSARADLKKATGEE